MMRCVSPDADEHKVIKKVIHKICSKLKIIKSSKLIQTIINKNRYLYFHQIFIFIFVK